MATITLEGNEIHTSGDLPKVGDTAPAFTLTNTDLGDVTLADFKGKKKLLDIVVSLDTGICANSAKLFDEKAGSHTDTEMLVITADLPFAAGRFCGAESANEIKTLSMMRDKNFAKDYGVLIQDGPLKGLCARAIVVIDENDKVIYTEQVPEIAQDPDYGKALAALG